MGIGKGACQISNLVIGLQHLTYLFWNFTESPDNLQIFVAMDGTLCLSHRQGNHRQHRHLSRKGLCRGHTNLWSHMNIGTRISRSGDAAANGITDTIDEGPLRLRKLYGSQRISRLTTLRDGNHHIIFRDNRIPVSELTGILHLHRNTTQAFDNLLTNQTGMP